MSQGKGHMLIVMVKSICQLVHECQDIWLNIGSTSLLGASVRRLLDAINIGIGRVSEVRCAPQCRWSSFTETLNRMKS